MRYFRHKMRHFRQEMRSFRHKIAAVATLSKGKVHSEPGGCRSQHSEPI